MVLIYLFLEIRDGIYPKGKFKNEIINEAAIREVIEETGVKNLRIKKPLPTTYHVYKANKKFKLKKTYWFLMETSYTGNLVPQIEENIDLAIWKFPEEIPKLMKMHMRILNF